MHGWRRKTSVEAEKCLKVSLFALGLMLVVSPPAQQTVLAAEVCYLYTPTDYQRQGGKHRLGPFPSRAECNLTRDINFRNRHDARCDCTEGTPPPKREEVCYLYTPAWYQRQGGPHRHGPFSSREACNLTKETSFRSSPDARCECS